MAETTEENKQVQAFGDLRWSMTDRIAWQEFCNTATGRRVMSQVIRLKSTVDRRLDSDIVYGRKLEFNNCVDEVATHLVMLQRVADDVKPQKQAMQTDNIDCSVKQKPDEEEPTETQPPEPPAQQL